MEDEMAAADLQCWVRCTDRGMQCWRSAE